MAMSGSDSRRLKYRNTDAVEDPSTVSAVIGVFAVNYTAFQAWRVEFTVNTASVDYVHVADLSDLATRVYDGFIILPSAYELEPADLAELTEEAIHYTRADTNVVSKKRKKHVTIS